MLLVQCNHCACWFNFCTFSIQNKILVPRGAAIGMWNCCTETLISQHIKYTSQHVSYTDIYKLECSLHSFRELCWQQLRPVPSVCWKRSPPCLWTSPCLTPAPIYHTTPQIHTALSCGDVRGLRAGTGELTVSSTFYTRWQSGWVEVRGRSPEGSL